MHIEDFESESVLVGESEKNSCDVRVRVSGDDEHDVVWDPKRVLIGAGARFLFYPTLVYNVVRNKVQTEFRWWDRIGQVIAFLLLILIFVYFVSVLFL